MRVKLLWKLAELITALLLLLSTSVFAATQSNEPFKVITSEELKRMMDNKTPGLTVIDTRSLPEYEDAHIYGAISIPWAKIENDPSALPFSKDATLVFYCSGLT